MCCMWLTGNAGPKKSPKIGHIGTIAHLYWALSSQLRHVLTIGKKILLSSNISSTCPHNMVNFDPLTAEIGPIVWGTPTNFSGFRVLASLLQQRKCLTQKISKNSTSGRHHTTLSRYIFATKAHINNWKNLLNSNVSPTCPHDMGNFGPLVAAVAKFAASQQISTGFASGQLFCMAL